MKALILSVKAGYGHHSCGIAMKEYFNSKGIECEMLDTLEYISRFLGEGVQNGYLLMTKYLGDAYGMAYDTLDKKEEPSKNYSPEVIISKFLSKKLEKYMVEYNPDFVIGTHSYATVLMTILKNRGILTCPTFGIVTDFTIHPFWESTDLDWYITPDELLTKAAEKKGIPSSKVLPIGIPIRQKFGTCTDKDIAKKFLGLSSKPMVLIMMGSMGFGDINEIIDSCDKLESSFQMTVICGNNEKALASISEQIHNKEMRCLGFTENVDQYMDAADVIITKPGGLTTSEALAKGLPLILMNPIPGQEERNMEFLVNTGAAMITSKTFPVEAALYQFFEHDWRKQIMKEAAQKLAKPESTKNLYEFVMSHVYNKEGASV